MKKWHFSKTKIHEHGWHTWKKPGFTAMRLEEESVFLVACTFNTKPKLDRGSFLRSWLQCQPEPVLILSHQSTRPSGAWMLLPMHGLHAQHMVHPPRVGALGHGGKGWWLLRELVGLSPASCLEMGEAEQRVGRSDSMVSAWWYTHGLGLLGVLLSG